MQSIGAQSKATLEARVKLIHAESKRVKALVASLSKEALERSSPCQKWDVGEVVAHLTWFAQTYGGMMERGLRGDQSPTEGFGAVPGTLSGPEIAELYGQSAIDLRSTLGDNLSATFTERYDWLNDLLKGIGLEDWDKPCFHTLRIRSVESFIPTIVGELAVHEWDIRSTLEPSPALSVNSIPVLMEKIPGNRLPWSTPFSARPPAPGPIRCRFELTGPGGAGKDIIIEGDKARMEDSNGGPANLCLSGDTESFVLLIYGRQSFASSISSGRFKPDGNKDLVPYFDRWLAGH
jgi:uncharacterized protein (TIGR03083 family)